MENIDHSFAGSAAAMHAFCLNVSPSNPSSLRMHLSSEQALLDLIYGAAVDPSLWEPAIAGFSDAIGGSGGWISRLSIINNSGGSADDPIARIDSLWLKRYVEYFEQKNPLHMVADPDAYARAWKPKILSDEDWMPRDDLVRTEFFNDFLKPQDMTSCFMIRLARFGHEFVTWNVGRPSRRGRFEQADLETAQRYHPHLIRAYKLSDKLSGLHALQGEISDVLDASPHGLVLVDGDGRIRHTNHAGAGLLRERGVFHVQGGRLSLVNSSVDRTLQRLIGQATASGVRSGGNVSLLTASRRWPLSLSVSPVAGERLVRFGERRTALICITDLEAGARFPEQKMQTLFGLTMAEARLAGALFEGLSLQDAAARFGISRNTAHVQLARVFDKTGTNAQSALVRLMMRLVGFTEGQARLDS